MAVHLGNRTLSVSLTKPLDLMVFVSDSLDESEPSISKKRVGVVKYFGILYIEDLNWISPIGKSLIQDDMRRHGLRLTLGNQTPSWSQITGPSSDAP